MLERIIKKGAVLAAYLVLLTLAFVAFPKSADNDPMVADLSLNQAREVGVIRVLTVEGPTTYFSTSDGPRGMEYELVKAFADHLGLRLEVTVLQRVDQLLPTLLRGEHHFALGVAVNDQQESLLRFSTSYHSTNTQVVYLRGQKRPRNIKQLANRHIVVGADRQAISQLQLASSKHEGIRWQVERGLKPYDLLQEVWQGQTELTLAQSHLVALTRQFYPELQVAFNLQNRIDLAWAFARHADNDSLFASAQNFLSASKANGLLSQVLDRHFGSAEQFNYVDVSTFLDKIHTTLPEFEALLKEAAEANDLDWRLLAAQAYQESRWNPRAVSPTGVKGFMQLTMNTAKSLGVKNRRDLQQSIYGGSKFLRRLIDRMPESIPEEERVWFAMAAYNVGHGHLEDARRLTERFGGNPSRWSDVKEWLPRLARKKWYRQTRYGFARGWEPVKYVSRIRIFYDILMRDEMENLALVRQARSRNEMIPFI